MRKFALTLIIVAGLGCIWFALWKPKTHDQNLKSFFQNGSSLKAGAPVCVDGVKLGVVTSVRVRPELGERPVEVLMAISTPYELSIPDDSTVALSAEGVLGPTFADIDTRFAHGQPLGNNGVLKSLEINGAKSTNNFIEALGDTLVQSSRKSRPQEGQPGSTEKPIVGSK